MGTTSIGRGVKRATKEPTKKQIKDWIKASKLSVTCVIQHPSGHVRAFYYKSPTPGIGNTETLYCFMLETNTIHRPVIGELLTQMRDDFKRAQLLYGKMPPELKKEKRK